MADGARTHDHWNHNPVLYQLSYAHHKPQRGVPGRNRTCNRRLRRPVLYPIELRALRNGWTHRTRRRGISLSTPPDHATGRGRGIRTPDIQLPKLALYQTELYPGFEAVGRRTTATRIVLDHWIDAMPRLSSEQKRCRSTLFDRWRARKDSNLRPPSS